MAKNLNLKKQQALGKDVRAQLRDAKFTPKTPLGTFNEALNAGKEVGNFPPNKEVEEKAQQITNVGSMDTIGSLLRETNRELYELLQATKASMEQQKETSNLQIEKENTIIQQEGQIVEEETQNKDLLENADNSLAELLPHIKETEKLTQLNGTILNKILNAIKEERISSKSNLFKSEASENVAGSAGHTGGAGGSGGGLGILAELGGGLGAWKVLKRLFGANQEKDEDEKFRKALKKEQERQAKEEGKPPPEEIEENKPKPTIEENKPNILEESKPKTIPDEVKPNLTPDKNQPNILEEPKIEIPKELPGPRVDKLPGPRTDKIPPSEGKLGLGMDDVPKELEKDFFKVLLSALKQGAKTVIPHVALASTGVGLLFDLVKFAFNSSPTQSKEEETSPSYNNRFAEKPPAITPPSSDNKKKEDDDKVDFDQEVKPKGLLKPLPPAKDMSHTGTFTPGPYKSPDYIAKPLNADVYPKEGGPAQPYYPPQQIPGVIPGSNNRYRPPGSSTPVLYPNIQPTSPESPSPNSSTQIPASSQQPSGTAPTPSSYPPQTSTQLSSNSSTKEGPIEPFTPSKSFAEKSPQIIKRLKEDFGLTDIQAAGFVGNLGHESAGFTAFHEGGKAEGSGGYGWAQWTGPRRKEFFKYAKENGLDPKSDEANYGFLKHELQTTEHKTIDALKQTNTLKDSTSTGESVFERAGIVNMASRNKYAQAALDSLKTSQQTQLASNNLQPTNTSNPTEVKPPDVPNVPITPDAASKPPEIKPPEVPNTPDIKPTETKKHIPQMQGPPALSGLPISPGLEGPHWPEITAMPVAHTAFSLTQAAKEKEKAEHESNQNSRSIIINNNNTQTKGGGKSDFPPKGPVPPVRNDDPTILQALKSDYFT